MRLAWPDTPLPIHRAAQKAPLTNLAGPCGTCLFLARPASSMRGLKAHTQVPRGPVHRGVFSKRATLTSRGPVHVPVGRLNLLGAPLESEDLEKSFRDEIKPIIRKSKDYGTASIEQA